MDKMLQKSSQLLTLATWMIVTSNSYATITYFFFPQEKRIHHDLVRFIKIPGDSTRQVKLALKVYTCPGLGNSCFKC